MTRLNRYVLKEILAPTLVAFVAYTGFMLVRGLVQFSDLVFQSEQPLRDTALVLAFSVPHIVVLTIPVSFLLGLLVGVGRLSADSELIALRAAGVDLVRLYRPIGILAALTCGLTLYLMLSIVPRTNALLYTLRLRLSSFAIVQRIQPGVFSPELGGYRIYVERASNDRRRLEGLIVSDRSNPSEGERLTFARSGVLETEEQRGRLWLRLESAVTHHVQPDPSRYDVTSYAEQRVLLSDVDPNRIDRGSAGKHLREQNLPQLLRTAALRRNPVEERMAMVEVHKKFALPFACLAFGLVGLPLGIVNRRGGRAAGFAVSVLIVLVYYMLFAAGEARAIDGATTPFLAMWTPNFLLLALGAVALRRVRRDRALFPALPEIRLTRRDPAKRVGVRFTARSLLLDRYVAARFLRLFLLMVVSVVVLYIVIDYLEISDDIARNSIPSAIIVRYFEAVVFPIIVDVVPFAFLAAALVAVAGLVRSAETTAILSSGVSLHRATLSLVVLALLAGGGLFALAERVVPRAALEAERLKNMIFKRPVMNEGLPVNLWFRGDHGRFFHAETFDAATKSATGVAVVELDPADFRLIKRTDGTRAVLVPDRGLVLEDGWTRSFGRGGDSLFLRRDGKFLVEAPEASKVFFTGRTNPRQMTLEELTRFVEARRRAGAEVARLSTGLYQKTAMPVSALLLTLVGLPFAYRVGKRGALAGIGVALLLGIAYFFISALLLRFGERGSLPPLLAAWGTNILFGLGAAHGLLGVRT
jgi:LPS export ABC transporter permease LptF/LPS export ABC transporter permease LptG